MQKVLMLPPPLYFRGGGGGLKLFTKQIAAALKAGAADRSLRRKKVQKKDRFG
jgi:hypothetical protein